MKNQKTTTPRKKHRVLGQMSGTSFDGQDMILGVFWEFDQHWEYQILAAETFSYPSAFVQKLAHAHTFTLPEIEELNQTYGHITQEHLQKFLNANPSSHPDLLCFHGHTVKHKPERGITLQLGTWQAWADAFHIPLVGDFRSPDVDLQGQGAPLVPGGDIHLFQEFDYTLNLGGFANVTDMTTIAPRAYDICAVNTVLNSLIAPFGMLYDDRGKRAAQGKIIPRLLDQLNSIPFYRQQPPKSLGQEWVSENLIPILDGFQHGALADLLHTYVVHIAQQMGQQFRSNKKILVTGGGAYHTFLIDQIQKNTDAKLILGTPQLIEYKEALIFGFLGLLRQQSKINCWASVTGASKNHSTGRLFFPKQ